MVEHGPAVASIYAFVTWEPVLRLLRASSADRNTLSSVQVSGQIGRHGWSLKLPQRMPLPGRALQTEDMQDELGAVDRVRNALLAADIDDVSFTAEISATGRTALHLLGPSPAVMPGIGNAYPGELILVEGAVPEPWRRLPEQLPEAVPASSADLTLLERTLRERLPDAIGAAASLSALRLVSVAAWRR